MVTILLMLLMSTPAHALTTAQHGPYLDLGVGLGLGEAPIQGLLGWNASFGWWHGPYDDAYAIGRYWSVGANLRQDWTPEVLRTAPMIEVRRGLDLIVVGWHGFVAGGPVITSAQDTRQIGGTVRAGAGAELRRTRHLGLTLRLEAGVDMIGGQVSGAGAALLGIQFSRPLKDPRS